MRGRRIARALCQAIVAVTLLASNIYPQAARRASLGDSLLVTDNIYNRLFDGITLSNKERDMAQDVIRKTFVSHQVLRPVTNQEKWRKIVTIQERRDSVLLSLVSDPAHKKKLLERTVDDRPKSSRWQE